MADKAHRTNEKLRQIVIMLDLQNMNHEPSLEEICDYIENPIFLQFYQYMFNEYNVLSKLEYSKDAWFRGWNIKLRKAGKGLCVIYPKEHYFTVLVVVGKKEKETVEKLLPTFSDIIQETYNHTKEGNGQRWLMIDIEANDEVYQNMLQLIRVRRESR